MMSPIVEENMKYEDHWPIDGHNHHVIARTTIYENGKIGSFFNSNRINLVIASKGMGKTLLMRVKKKIVIDSNDSAMLIPKNDDEFDEPKLQGSFSQSGYTDLQFWKSIWTVSIVFSILNHIEGLWGNLGHRQFLEGVVSKFEIDRSFKEEILDNIRTCARVLPSEYLARLLLGYSENSLYDFLRSANTADELSRQLIGSAVYVFIDGFDQTLTETFYGNRSAWKTGQRGLAKATHTLFTKNHHVKVFATIRQEAWSGFKDDDREVIKGKSIILDHTERDLRNLFEKAICRYTNQKSILEFFGMPTIHNSYCCDNEDTFEYIFRHSTGTPRSLMYFGRALDEQDLHSVTDVNARMIEFKDKVDDVAAENVYSDYLAGQKQMFLDTLVDEERLRILAELIPSNVLTVASLKSINKEFCKILHIVEEESHPFCELYNLGLLGRVKQNAASGGHLQYFRKPYDFDWKHTEILRSGAIYLVHPGLFSAISRVRTIQINRVNIVGSGKKWGNRESRDGVSKNGIPEVFVSHSSIDKEQVRELLTSICHEINLLFPADVWFDEWKIQAGDNIHQEVERGVASADVVILFASASSLGSPWVEEEWKTKHFDEIESRSIKVIVVIIDDTRFTDLPRFLRNKLALRIGPGAPADAAAKLAKSVCENAILNLERDFPIGF